MISQLYNGDCLEVMQIFQERSIDMILCDLPYGVTRNKWDIPVDFARLWQQYERIIKDNGAIVLFSMQPFTAKLIMSNLRLYRYEWIWHKTQPKGHLNAKKMPLRAHENIEVFYKHPPTYNPQKTTGHLRKVARSSYERQGSGCYGTERRKSVYDSTERYPRSVLSYSNGNQSSRYHVSQKPVGLCEYLIRTYTNEGESVLDNCMGSGSTGIAAVRSGRCFIGIEIDTDTYNTAVERIREEEARYEDTRAI